MNNLPVEEVQTKGRVGKGKPGSQREDNRAGEEKDGEEESRYRKARDRKALKQEGGKRKGRWGIQEGGAGKQYRRRGIQEGGEGVRSCWGVVLGVVEMEMVVREGQAGEAALRNGRRGRKRETPNPIWAAGGGGDSGARRPSD